MASVGLEESSKRLSRVSVFFSHSSHRACHFTKPCGDLALGDLLGLRRHDGEGSDDKVPIKLPETFFLPFFRLLEPVWRKLGNLGEFRLLGASFTGI